jgi:hypothetical protein
MTVSANPTPDLKRDQLLDAAIRVTGILTDDEEPSQRQIRIAATYFDFELGTLQSEGVIVTTVERATLPFVAGTCEYTLPSDTIDTELGQNDVIGTVKDTNGTTETMVTTMSAGEHLQLAVKTTTGRPSRCFSERSTSAVKLLFWPIPDSTMATFQYRRVRFLRAMDSGDVTTDLVRTWSQYLMCAVGKWVARSNSLYDRARDLAAEQSALFARCKAGDAQHGQIRLTVGHSGRNW